MPCNCSEVHTHVEMLNAFADQLPETITVQALAGNDDDDPRTLVIYNHDENSEFIASFGPMTEKSIGYAFSLINASMVVKHLKSSYIRMASALEALYDQAEEYDDVETCDLISDALDESFDGDPLKTALSIFAKDIPLQCFNK